MGSSVVVEFITGAIDYGERNDANSQTHVSVKFDPFHPGFESQYFFLMQKKCHPE